MGLARELSLAGCSVDLCARFLGFFFCGKMVGGCVSCSLQDLLLSLCDGWGLELGWLLWLMIERCWSWREMWVLIFLFCMAFS